MCGMCFGVIVTVIVPTLLVLTPSEAVNVNVSVPLSPAFAVY